MSLRRCKAVVVGALVLCLSGCGDFLAADGSKTAVRLPAERPQDNPPGEITERLAALYGGEENFRTLAHPDRVEATVLIVAGPQTRTHGPFAISGPQARELSAILSHETSYRWETVRHPLPGPNVALRFIRGEAHLDLFYGWEHDVLFVARDEHLVGQCEARVAPVHDRLMLALDQAIRGLSVVEQIR